MSWRSVRALFAGALTAIITTTLVGVAAASLTARLAPSRPMKHALVLGGLGAVVALIGAVTTWNMGLGPKWYPISLVILALPEAWLGAKIAMTRRAEAAA